MISIELEEAIKKLVALVEAKQYKGILFFIESLSEHFPAILQQLINASLETNKDPNINNAVELLDKQPVGHTIVQLNDLINNLNEFGAKTARTGFIPAVKLALQLQDFFDIFEKSVGKFRFENTIKLCQIAHDINFSIKDIHYWSISLREMLSTTLPLKENNQKISLYFDAPIEYDEIIIKLQAIKELYNELCRLLNISTSEYPLQLVQFEVGSWWIKLFGESRVITLLTNFMEKSVSYFHRTYTTEGKIQSIPKNVEAINTLLELSQNFKKSGIDTEVLNKNLEHSAIVISNQLNALLLNEPKVKINDTEHYIGNELDKRFLQSRRSLFLESGEPEESEESENPNPQA